MRLVIKNGTIIDGTGGKPYAGDIVVDNDTILNIGSFPKATGDTVIDAGGQYVVPGFVDILNHSDSYWTLFKVPTFDSLITQGITTVLVGNCGSSLAPLVEGETILTIQKWANMSEVNVNWLRLSEFLDEVSRRKLALNFATLVGHATLRRGLLREDFRALGEEELEKMKFLLYSALEEGAFGMSVGLAYSHAKVASSGEIEELSRVVRDKGNGLLAFHLRDEAKGFLGAVNEVLGITRRIKVSSHISHFKVMGEENWPQFERALDMVQGINEEAFDTTFDVYPYTTIASVLYIFLPDWASKGGRKMLVKRLKEPEIREKLIGEMKKTGYSYKDIWIAGGVVDTTFVGKSILEIAKNQGVEPEEAVINMLIASGGKIIAFIPTLNKKNLTRGVKSKYSFIASDGFGVNVESRKEYGLVHPRCFGSFPRTFAQFVRDSNILSWEEAIYKMTAGPARKIKLSKRGELQKKYFADIVILNPDTIRDRATFTNPFRYSEGIEYVIVNGRVVLEKGKRTGEMPGKVLRKK